jgi:phage terminase large subunit
VVKQLLVNDIYIPLINNQSRFLILYGGAGSGKSNFAAFKIIKRILSEKGHKFLCLRKISNTIKDSIFAELQAAISDQEVEHEFIINKTEHSFKHIPTGNMILCKGLDEPNKIKSIKGITGMWLEEASEFDENDLDQLDIRIRGEKENYVQYIITFNPIDETHWLKKRFFDKNDPQATTCHSTYLNNFFLTDEDGERLRSLKDRNELYYDIYCLGKWGIVDKSNKFMYAFNSSKHVIPQLEYIPNPRLPLLISFDFNVSPMTCIIGQQISEMKAIIFDEMELDNGSTEELSEIAKAKYIKWLGDIDITGDATGRNREKATRGNINQYRVIKEVLGLDDRNILVRRKNLALKDSKVLCNSVLQHAEMLITANCEKTIRDVTFATIKVNPMTKKMDVIKTELEGRHFFDNYRYFIGACFPDFIKNPKDRGSSEEDDEDYDE